MAAIQSRRDMTRRILAVLADAGGTVVESFFVPYEELRIAKMFEAEGHLEKSKMFKKLRSLESQQLISLKEKKGEVTITLEKAGTERTLRYHMDEMTIPRPASWDHKWRLILFDIPEEHKVARNYFHDKIEALGFIQLQHSAYIHPFECHNEIEFIRSLLGLKSYVKMLVVDKVEGEASLRKSFDLL